MKKQLFVIAFALCSCLNAYSQATSMTVDCQNPGWLSSLISYGDQQTLENLKVTGYINGTDIQLIYDLTNKRSLNGVIDFEDVYIVSGGTLTDYPKTVEKDNALPSAFFNKQTGHIQKFIYPNTLTSKPSLPFQYSNMVDSLIWTSTSFKTLYISTQIGFASYISLPEGVEQIIQIPANIKIVFPKTLTRVDGGINSNLTIYSFIEDPEIVYAKYEDYSNGSYSYWAAITNSRFYIPKGTKEKYLRSNFATMSALYKVNGNSQKKPNNNIFIEYYDVDSTIVTPSLNMYVGDAFPLDVKVYPNDSLVSRIDYVSLNPEIASVQSDGTVVAEGYGQTEVLATPYVFIDGLETKTGSCVVRVLAHVEGVDLMETLSLHIGEEYALNAQTLPLGFSDNQIVFESSNSSIATVNENGVVSGKQKGTCTITATSVDGGYTATCEITVTQPVEALTLEKHSLSLKVGNSETLFAQISPSTADNKTISWYSSNAQVASVDANGNVAALKAGEVWIKAVSNDNAEAKDSCKVTILQPVTGITLSQESCRLTNIGEFVQLEATVLPDDASNKEVNWRSTNEAVCMVSNGKVVATGYGTAVVLATTVDGGFMASCAIVVEKDVVSVTEVVLSQTSATLIKGGTLQLTATALPADATNKTLIWKSSNENVCVTTQTGMLVAMNEGTAVITVVPELGVGQAQCNVTVEAEPSAIHEIIGNNADDSAIYDMQGRRVNQVVKGRLYIVNGKKYIAK